MVETTNEVQQDKLVAIILQEIAKKGSIENSASIST
jgi:hypothetical protein